MIELIAGIVAIPFVLASLFLQLAAFVIIFPFWIICGYCLSLYQLITNNQEIL